MAYFGTTTPLAANGTYVMGPQNTDRADSLTGSVFASHAGNLYIEQSGDGQNWDVSTNKTVAPGVGQGFTESLYLPYVRMRFVNGATAQTALRVFGRFGSAGDS